MRTFESYNVDDIKKLLYSFYFTRKVSAIHIHHTYIPTKTDYVGEKTILRIWEYHTKTKGWSDIGQHVTLLPDGLFVTGRNFAVNPGWHYNSHSSVSIRQRWGNTTNIVKGVVGYEKRIFEPKYAGTQRRRRNVRHRRSTNESGRRRGGPDTKSRGGRSLS